MALYEDRHTITLGRGGFIGVLLLIAFIAMGGDSGVEMTTGRLVVYLSCLIVSILLLTRGVSRFRNWFSDFWWRINRPERVNPTYIRSANTTPTGGKYRQGRRE